MDASAIKAFAKSANHGVSIDNRGDSEAVADVSDDVKVFPTGYMRRTNYFLRNEVNGAAEPNPAGADFVTVQPVGGEIRNLVEHPSGSARAIGSALLSINQRGAGKEAHCQLGATDIN